jgi:hypothetical protein
MKCDRALELVSAYCEGGLGVALSVPFEAHLAGCDGCRAAADDVARLHRGLSALPLVSAPDALRVEIWRRIDVAERPAVPARRFVWRLGPARIAVAAAGAALIVALAGRTVLPGAFRSAGWSHWLTGGQTARLQPQASGVPFAAGAISLQTDKAGVTLSVPVTNTSKSPVVFSASVAQGDGDDAPTVTVPPGMSAVLSASVADGSNATRLNVRWKQGPVTGVAEYSPRR